MKRTYLQPTTGAVTLHCVSVMLAGSPTEPRPNQEHKLTKWIGSREVDFDEEEDDESSESFW
jgi:hypothetical protein